MSQTPNVSPILRYQVHGIGRCMGCGAILVKSELRQCPECGREFDPADPTTFAAFREPGPWGRFVLSPLGWPSHTAAAIATFLILVSVSIPGGMFLLLMAGGFLWEAVGLFWFARVVAHIGAKLYFRPAASNGSGRRKRWYIVPVTAITTIILCYFNCPLRLTLALSRWDMDRVARQVAASGKPVNRSWIGLYPVEKIEVVSGGMRFIVRGSGFMDKAGFAYSPAGPPPVIGEDFYTHLSGPWYEWVESW